MKLFNLCFFSLLLSISSAATFSPKVGVNYGTLGNNLPKPTKSVELIKSLKAGRVKLYSPDPEILTALGGTNLQVSIMVPNEIISNISTNQKMANDWIKTNLVAYPHTLIRYVLVGNEILSFMTEADKKTWHDLVPAMRKIQYALKVNGIRKVKVGTTLAMDVLESSYPPSNGTFRSDIADTVMKPMLQFLSNTKSFLFIDCYPYFAWSQSYKTISLDYALFNGGVTYKDPGSGLTYTNLLDQMLDSVHFAMKKLGYPDIRIWIAETGWPNGGDIDQIGANVYNAATYNRNLVQKLNAKPSVGTPAMPDAVLPTFVFALFNENQKGGPGTERHWGQFYPNGSTVYPIDLTGKTPVSSYPPLPKPDNNEPYKGKIWCVVASNANITQLADAVTYACGQGKGTCAAIQPKGNCYNPNSLVSHASYAFSSYFSQMKSQGGTCYFNGLAVQTAKDPSSGKCKYPSVTLP
ncbi:probable glucan endo-1,3-beta-glucosidase A6 [Chenopodium quinoa]|uniref:probable glucan endo-1,3-beta-glucosidase A6 n=1 Tax=Chenopodium quinoa TaxID=63459 RepID=UPI000B78668B|nr:probable glucan endo-1,3-beta-glucosidase A6 [Chenopodium quinoa]